MSGAVRGPIPRIVLRRFRGDDPMEEPDDAFVKELVETLLGGLEPARA